MEQNRIYDRLRHIEVPLTPEERVRQWFVSVLENDCKVPVSLMNTEVGFTLGAKRYRADILVWDRDARPLAVVECKAPSVKLTEAVFDQAIRYNMALGLKWIVLTNGVTVFVFRRQGDGFVPFDKLPDYDEMLSE